ncbi:YfhO family protein, partial [Streptococcus suis]|uniref:YfhO family protein n=1 Tax=Streptococcus suis TaxID=1307 RepID=UPI0012903FF3
SGLGLNFYALSSYYLGSFLSPIVFFFDLQSMPDALYLVTIVKFGLIGLSTFTSLKGIYKNVTIPWALLLSSAYALMSFSTSQLEINSWLDVFILIPIILLGLHQLVRENKQ